MKKIFPLLLVIMLLAACGRKGVLVPPEGLVPAQVSELQLSQRGAGLQLSWTMPNKMASGGKLTDLAGFRVMRREVLPPAEDCEQCPDAYRLLKMVDLAYLQGASRLGGQLYLLDTEVTAKTTYQYRVSAVNKDGESGIISSPVRGTVIPPLPSPRLSATATPTGVELHVSAAPLPTGATLIGFTIYRVKKGGTFSPIPITPQPITTPTYEDSRLERGIVYTYVAGVEATINGERIESVLSPPIAISMAEPD